MRTLVALGDSFSCGEGVGVRIDVSQTWVGLLARTLGADLDVLAVAGATVGGLRVHQLPVAMHRPSALATVLVGLNDVFSSDYDGESVRDQLGSVIAELRRRHRPVLVARLHDPCATLPLPSRVRAVLRDRLAAINAVVDSSIGDGVIVFDLASVPVLGRREGWAVDRLHPSAVGHRAIGLAAAEALSAMPAKDLTRQPSAVVPTRLDECRWAVRHGSPWMVKRLWRVGPPIAGMLFKSGQRTAAGADAAT